MYDIAVIGGGTVGSRVAGRLAGWGHRVVVLERKPQIGDTKCCTGIVGQECVAAFAIPEKVILRQVNSARLFSPSGEALRVWRAEPQASILDRGAFERDLAERAQSAGAEYLLGFPVSNIQTGADSVQVEAASSKFEARAVVVAAGFGSKLTGQVGLGSSADFVAGAQAEVEIEGVDEVEVYFGRKVAPGFFGWLVPTSPRTARIGLLSRRLPDFYLKSLMKSLLAQGKIVSDKAEADYGAIPLKPLRRTYGERLLVVGDAAGQVKPTTGGGIYYGLLCADMAAETLHQALEVCDFSAASLAKYERRWRRKLGRHLRAGYWARQLFERLTDRQIDRLFAAMKQKGIAQALLQDSELSFDWHGKLIATLIGRGVVAGALGAFHIPAWLARD